MQKYKIWIYNWWNICWLNLYYAVEYTDYLLPLELFDFKVFWLELFLINLSSGNVRLMGIQIRLRERTNTFFIKKKRNTFRQISIMIFENFFYKRIEIAVNTLSILFFLFYFLYITLSLLFTLYLQSYYK